MKGSVTMSIKDTERITIFDRLMKKEIKQKQAAKLLRLSTRQVRTLAKRYKREGVLGIVHRLRGTVGNRLIPESVITTAIETVQKDYVGFGPTLAHENLVDYHGCTFSRETLRKAMVENGLWQAKHCRIVNLHQTRERRECLGELIQADGSPHAWFEDRGERCTLLVFIDDATGKILWLEFTKSESTIAYLVAMKQYLKRHGKPLALYVDKHGVFRVNTTKCQTAGVDDTNGITQFGRAMNELGIEVIFANSPQAKGRVERVNQTLQDRLVKQLRLQAINSIQEANAYLPEFIETFNKKFAVVPKSPVNMHRLLQPNEKLDDTLCLKYTRILSSQLSLSFGSRIYQIQTSRPLYAMRHAPVTVKQDIQGKVTIWYKDKLLAYKIIKHQPRIDIVDTKQLNQVVDHIVSNTNITTTTKIPWIPPINHPWRHYQIT